MPTGFIYVVRSVGRDYEQPDARAVPCFVDGRIYFGPCKKSMRPKMRAGDYVFGLSPSGTRPRRFVFAARIDERLSFADAYSRFPTLHGPGGPIHVKPTTFPGSRFPLSTYEHIPGSIHPADWHTDLRTEDMDAFFVCQKSRGAAGRWLGRDGPSIDGTILQFLRTCSVHGNAGRLADRNGDASAMVPIRHGGLFTGLHLETNHPEELMALVEAGTDPAAKVSPGASRRRPPRRSSARAPSCGTKIAAAPPTPRRSRC